MRFEEYVKGYVDRGYAMAEMLAHEYSLKNDWKVVESIDTDVKFAHVNKIKRNHNRDGNFDTSYTANGKIYRFMATINNKEAFIRFYPWSDDTSKHFIKSEPEVLVDDDGNPRLNKRGKPLLNIRSSAVVFSGVMKSIDMMLDEYDIDTIVFDTAYKELKSLYKTMHVMIKRKYPEWEVDVIIDNKYIYKRK